MALTGICDGSSRSDAARLGDVTVVINRDRVVRFNARGLYGLINGKAPGNRPKLNDAQRQALADVVEREPIDPGNPRRGAMVTARIWCAQSLGEFSIEIDETTVGPEFRAPDFAKLSAWPRHDAQARSAGRHHPDVPAIKGARIEPVRHEGCRG
ncbi:COG3415 family protein [Jiella pelagia]|uniref:TNase-like domain-containing protein n=1 Tax=Jiella pelagia TaxID=2986949 RepID=A0ABY7BTX5_9HYPH|nr:hypothetical protein [Jiella pelagia]WAP67171.1 hypothetical protein OH818_16415 [Jiella pelagia]